ncbi:hypothetical protein RCO27_12210 [Sphingosinicella sp. LHD-64]|uniref:hypothetical protein n=1 Tax=Sphingosinicella sp. LHD-64 TaxID=3072139 RepID=UPI00280DF855|nr:hypothetical protein [Sphingosinicella sp. LHD-64]MDQ8756992.1 hypothetical protein [Sphingosinicella sp. LHD-64]
MKTIATLGLALLAVGSAGAEGGQSSPEVDKAAEALAGRTAGTPVSCVNLRDLRGNRSIGDGAILFEGAGNIAYVNRPAGGCPDLGAGRTLVTRTPSGQLCRGDIARVVDLTSGVEYGSCGLGDFVPYSRR